jgi:hypothetical protein
MAPPGLASRPAVNHLAQFPAKVAIKSLQIAEKPADHGLAVLNALSRTPSAQILGAATTPQ